MGRQVEHGLYNIMFQSLLLFGITLASISLQVATFQIEIGQVSDLLDQYGFSQAQEVEQSGLFVRRTLVFPYDVYEMPTRGSSYIEAKSFIFLKMQYELLVDSLTLQKQSLPRIDQYDYLYKILPEAVLFQGKQNEYMEFIRTDPSLFNPNFIIKNSTSNNYKKTSGVFTLSFYSLQITKFIQKTIKEGEKDMNSALKEELVQSLLEKNSIYTKDGIRSNQTQRNESILTNFLANHTSLDHIYPNFLINTEFTREISQETLWSVQYDGFSIYYASAVMQKHKQAEGEDIIDMTIVVSREGEQKRIQHMQEPMSYLNLSSINHLDLCTSGNKLKFLIADRSNIYVIDISTNLWSLDCLKTNLEFSWLLFDNECKIIRTEHQNVTQLKGVNKRSFQQPITTAISLKNFFIFCISANICKVYSKNNFKELAEIKLTVKDTLIEWQQLVRINTSVIAHQIGYRQKWQNYQLFEQISTQEIIVKNANFSSSYFHQFIYPYSVYLDKPLLRSKQMDRTFFHHLQSLENRQLPNNYYDFSKYLQENTNCSLSSTDETEQKVTINAQGKWSVCNFSQTTNSLMQLKIVTDQTQARMYICQTSLQNLSVNPEINCQYFITSSKSEKNFYIPSNKLIKFYILKNGRFPTFYFKDIEKQQLAFASTIFFYLMLSLAISFFSIIIFIILRPALVAVMIYYGWRQDLTAPTYPLGWFQLKIKIKRLVQMKFLGYVPHEPTNGDEDNHCCFCLQNLARGAIVAQLYCLHEFHQECFNEWIKNEPNLRCPTCRREFTRQHLHDFRSSHNIMS